MRRTIWLALLGLPHPALAADVDNNGCDDAIAAANGACVHPTADLGGNSVGNRSYVGPYTRFIGDVVLAPRASFAGSSTSTFRTITGATSVGRRASIGFDANLGPGNSWAADVAAGDRLSAGAAVTVGYGALLGDDVTLGNGASIGSLVDLGDHVEIGDDVSVGRESQVASGTAGEPTQVLGSVGADVQIGSGAIVDTSARVATGSTIAAGAWVQSGARIGRRVTVQAGAVVGTGSTVRQGSTIQAGVEVPPFTFVPRDSTFGHCTAAVANPTPLVISTPTTIGAADTTYECRHVVISSTVTMSGEHRFRSLTIASGGNLTHPQGQLEGVTVLVDGLFHVQVGGKVDVSARGGIGGFNNGQSASGQRWTATGMTTSGGSFGRAGGSYAAYGTVYSTGSPAEVYGAYRNPRELGSGGGAGGGTNASRGGDGGGRIDVTAGDAQLDGQLLANGTNCAVWGGGGSGGAIRVAVSGALSGSGVVRANGGGGSQCGVGSGGRVAITDFQSGSFTGVLEGGTVFVLGASRTAGVWGVNGAGASATIATGESPSVVRIENGGALTVDVPLTLPSLTIGGSLTMNAPLTVSGAITTTTGTSTFHQPVTAASWSHSGGSTAIRATSTVPVWTQSGGAVTLFAPSGATSYAQTGGSLRIEPAVTFAPSTYSLANGTLDVAGTATLPMFRGTNVSGTTTVTNTGVLQIVDDALVEIPVGTTLHQNGVLRGQGRPDGTVGALTVAGTLRRSVQSQSGLSLTILGSLDVSATGVVDVSGAGGKGGWANGGVANGERWSPTGPTTTDGAHRNAGGSYGASGTVWSTGSPNAVQGDYRAPVEYGSGGGAGGGTNSSRGGDGGGRIDLTATNATLNGTLRANGTGCTLFCGGGSGGAIRVAVTGHLDGTGLLQAVGAGGSAYAGVGGGGRVAITGFQTGSFSGTTQAGTAFVLASDGTGGWFKVDGGGAAATIGAGEVADQIGVANGGALTVNTPLTLPSFTVGGSLTMNEPLTVTGTLTMSAGASTFQDPVSVGAWSQSGGAATFLAAVTAPTWTQSGGSVQFDAPIATTTWNQTGGSLTVSSGVSFVPSTFTFANSTLTNAGTTTLPSFRATNVSGTNTVTNTGTFVVVDDTLFEIPAGTTFVQHGVFRGQGRADGTFAAVRVGGTLRRTTQTMEGLRVQALGQLHLQAGSLVDVNGGGGRGGNTNGGSAPGQRWTATGPTTSGGSSGQAGGGYGTAGGVYQFGGSNATYGDPTNPIEYGSGGATGGGTNSARGGDGGGRVDFAATDAILDGTIRANGAGCTMFCGGGSGGAIKVALTGSLSGTGLLQAVGAGGNAYSAVGGGGRIAVVGNTSGSFTGTSEGGTRYLNGALQ
jgi:acyl-[acyl carrier protein]--UDP-N-acetylglucosamine O-acyltransferase